MDDLILKAPTSHEFGMIAETLSVSAELCGDESAKFVSIAAASPHAGNLIESLANASVWLAAWSGIVEEAKNRLLASAPGGAA